MFVVATLGFVASNAYAQDSQAENVDSAVTVQEEIAEVEDAPAIEEAKDADVLYGVQQLDEVKNLAEAAPAVDAVAQAVAPAGTAVSGGVVSGGAGAAQVYGPCEECYEVGIRGVGFGRGVDREIGFGRIGGRGGAFSAARRGRLGSRSANREIVAPSPYANPTGSMQDWARFRNYPYGYYPQNFGAPDMSVPRYNPRWQNYYPNARRFHEGKHFILDVF